MKIKSVEKCLKNAKNIMKNIPYDRTHTKGGASMRGEQEQGGTYRFRTGLELVGTVSE